MIASATHRKATERVNEFDTSGFDISPVVKVPLGFDSKQRACFALPLSFSTLQTRHSY
jgi:hypothetical protein